MFLETSRIF
ncbi:hypothetical protein CGLO_14929 [Colletotrichum gloeosporioides Cg-14]|uniref:Uncharacterized protein n=1 Tax=Colletotrichum gloeosporioides (strain Cg-14) TaxID=1237896 RepID=T0K2X2_COLGC|nr:hypothetical protein CGLO_14929 [Colletotrichum gloeosporioides Cg-14]